MIRRASFFLIGILVLSNSAISAKVNSFDTLQIQRQKVIYQYINDLQNADYKDITNLFVKNGLVVSTSRGNMNAKDFFYAFLPYIETANTKLHQSFFSDTDSNRYAARFHFDYKLKDGESGSGEYIDEFIFMDDSALLSSVIMFENLKFINNEKIVSKIDG